MIIATKTMSVWAPTKKRAYDILDKRASVWFEAIIESIKDNHKNIKFASVSPQKIKGKFFRYTATYAIDVVMREQTPPKVVVQSVVVSVKKPTPETIKKTPKKVYKKATKQTKKTAKKPIRDAKGRFIKKK